MTILGDIKTPDNVEWLFSMSPGGVGSGCGGGDFYEVKQPTSHKNTLCHRLCKRYRNSPVIRDIHNWWLWHTKLGNIDLSDEILLEKNCLPKGSTPLWIQADKTVTDICISNVFIC